VGDPDEPGDYSKSDRLQTPLVSEIDGCVKDLGGRWVWRERSDESIVPVGCQDGFWRGVPRITDRKE
jgi:hypothetical protein